MDFSKKERRPHISRRQTTCNNAEASKALEMAAAYITYASDKSRTHKGIKKALQMFCEHYTMHIDIVANVV